MDWLARNCPKSGCVPFFKGQAQASTKNVNESIEDVIVAKPVSSEMSAVGCWVTVLPGPAFEHLRFDWKLWGAALHTPQ